MAARPSVKAGARVAAPERPPAERKKAKASKSAKSAKSAKNEKAQASREADRALAALQALESKGIPANPASIATQATEDTTARPSAKMRPAVNAARVAKAPEEKAPRRATALRAANAASAAKPAGELQADRGVKPKPVGTRRAADSAKFVPKPAKTETANLDIDEPKASAPAVRKTVSAEMRAKVKPEKPQKQKSARIVALPAIGAGKKAEKTGAHAQPAKAAAGAKASAGAKPGAGAKSGAPAGGEAAAGVRKAVWSEEDLREEEQGEQEATGKHGKKAKILKFADLKRERRKQQAEKEFNRQYGGSNAASGEGGPRAALYKGEMGRKHKQAVGMQGGGVQGPSGKPRVPFSVRAGRVVRSPRFVTTAVVMAALIMVGTYLYGPVKTYYKQVRSYAQLEAECEAVETRNTRLKQEIEYLQSPAGIEEKAREQFGWIMPGEHAVLVYGLANEHDAADEVNKSVMSGSVPAPETWYSKVLDAIFGVS